MITMKTKFCLESAWSIFNKETVEEGMEEDFELDDILVGISMKFINYRIENNLTQKQLAQELGITQAMVSKYESGDYNPSVEQLFRISKKLGWIFNINFSEKININETEWIKLNDTNEQENIDDSFEFGECA